MNDKAIRDDFQLLYRREGFSSRFLHKPGNSAGSYFIEPGAEVECSVLNASAGPIHIGAKASIMEGCLIRGPLAHGRGCSA